MSNPGRLRLADVRAVYRLVGECRELGDDPAAWRRHWYAGIAGLIGADLVLGGELAGLAGGQPRSLGTAEWGWERGFDRAGWLRALELMRTDPNYNLLFRAYGERFRSEDGVALSVTDMIDQRTWLRSLEYREVYRPIGVDHNLWCARSIPGAGGETSGAFFCRAARGRDFGPRDKAIVRDGHAALGGLVGGALARFSEPSPAALPPRSRQVLRCFLEGDSDKQVAARLGMSVLTVNVHTKTIYRYFGVSSRAELLARWVRRGWGAGGPPW